MMKSVDRETDLQVAEIRHRVANCFQFLSAIVHFRLKRTPDPVARDQLTWALEVIRAVSLLHHYPRPDDGQNFGDYLQELVKCWRPLLEVQSIRIETDTEPVELGSDISSSLALIVQELLTNSAKHAFNNTGGVVRIELNSRGSEAELTVTDNGRGMRQQTPCSPGLGMTIVRQLSERIGATIIIDSHASGTVTRLRFPVGNA